MKSLQSSALVSIPLFCVALALVGCGSIKHKLDQTKADNAVPVASSAAKGDVSLALADNFFNTPSEELVLTLTDSTEKTHEKRIQSGKASEVSFSGLPAGKAVVKAKLLGSPDGPLEGEGQVDIQAGKQQKLHIDLSPAGAGTGGVNISIGRPVPGAIDGSHPPGVCRGTHCEAGDADVTSKDLAALRELQKVYRDALKATIKLDCRAQSDCVAVAFGAKACGGPEGYLVASRTASDMQNVNEKSRKEIEVSEKINVLAGLASNCAFQMPPALVCASSTSKCEIAP